MRYRYLSFSSGYLHVSSIYCYIILETIITFSFIRLAILCTVLAFISIMKYMWSGGF